MKKNIFLYMNFFPEDKTIGITKKILHQIATLKDMEFNVYYSGYLIDGVAIFNNNDVIISKKKIVTGKVGEYYRRFALLKLCNDFIINTDIEFDIGYLRYHSFDKKYLSLLKNMKNKKMKTIVEAHAYSSDLKITNIKLLYIKIQEMINWKKIHYYVDLVAAMCNQSKIWDVETIQIDNSIDFDSIKARNYTPHPSKIRFITVAIERDYHGYDRFINGLYKYYSKGGQKDIIVNFVGQYSQKTKKLINDLNLSDRCLFQGKQQGSNLDKIYNESDIAIGALAHHRVGMYSGSSLKTKEYFAKGIPFIYGWDEMAFDKEYPYAMQIDLTDDPIEIDKVISFFDTIKNCAYETEMRAFAKKNFICKSQFDKIFAKLDEM